MDRVPCGVAVLLPIPGKRLIDPERFVLMFRQGKHGANQWACPGGWVDPGEDPADTCVRECTEELGITVTSVHLVGYTHDLHPEGIEDICLWFYADEWSGTPKIMEPEKCSDIFDFTVENLKEAPEGSLFTPLVQFLDVLGRFG